MKFQGVYIIAFAWLTACTTANVVSFYNEEVDFGKYTTFRIINPANRNEKLSEKNQQSDEKIERAIIREMNFRGYQYNDASDLKIYYRIILDTNVNYHVDDYYGSGSYYYPYYSVSSYEYKEGILLVEMKDAATRKTIWQGSMDLKIKSRSKVDPVNDAMRLIFEEYPFHSGNSQPDVIPEND